MSEPTAYEQYILELVNRARTDPATEAARLGIDLNQGLAAGTISTAAKQPLAFNPLLLDAAGSHSEWMIATDSFSHTGVGGSSPGARMQAAGYVFSGSWSWGENIALRSGALDATTAGALHDQLFLSASHRTNILNGNFREAGFGLAEGDYRGYTASVLTENFAKSGSSVFLLGVAFDDADGDRFYDPGEGLGGVTLTIRNTVTGATSGATTWSAGGYQLALAAGSYEVTFSGGGLATPVLRSVTIGGSNVKLDLDVDALVASPPPPPPPPDAGLVLTGTSGANALAGGTGADSIAGLGGADTLTGAGGNDTLSGGGGNDRLQGGAGNDLLVGGSGADTLTGGSGGDLFVFRAVTERGDRIADFDAAAGDRVDIGALLVNAAGDDWMELSASGHARLTSGSAGAVLWVDADGGGNAWTSLVTFTGKSVAALGTEFLIG